MKSDNEVRRTLAKYSDESPEWFRKAYFNDTIVHTTVMHCAIQGFTTQQMQLEVIKNLGKGLDMLRNDSMDFIKRYTASVYLVDSDKCKCPPSDECESGYPDSSGNAPGKHFGPD